MTYQSITNQILEIISESTEIISQIYHAEDLIKKDISKKQEIIDKLRNIRNEWYRKCQNVLLYNELLLEHEEFINYSDSTRHILGINDKLNYANNELSYVYDPSLSVTTLS